MAKTETRQYIPQIHNQIWVLEIKEQKYPSIDWLDGVRRKIPEFLVKEAYLHGYIANPNIAYDNMGKTFRNLLAAIPSPGAVVKVVDAYIDVYQRSLVDAEDGKVTMIVVSDQDGNIFKDDRTGEE
jgi:hypothetical protein